MDTARTTTVAWTSELVEQQDRRRRTQLRPPRDGLTDEEHRWEPVRPAARSLPPVVAAAEADQVPITDWDHNRWYHRLLLGQVPAGAERVLFWRYALTWRRPADGRHVPP